MCLLQLSLWDFSNTLRYELNEQIWNVEPVMIDSKTSQDGHYSLWQEWSLVHMMVTDLTCQNSEIVMVINTF